MARALADGWGLSAGTLRYAPVGGGSYHWVVTDGRSGRWFVTVDDLDDKGWLGQTRPTVFSGLRTAMDAALWLRREAGLGFVVAPVLALDGQAVRLLGARHAVAVYPYLPGSPGQWDHPLAAPELDELVAMLAALHRVDPATVRLPHRDMDLSWRGDLEVALRELGRLVITHGEPHPGNVIRIPAGGARLPTAGARLPADAGQARGGIMLIDWDTVALAPPERDLWMVATETGEELRRYTELTGRPVDATGLELYRLRWALDDLSCFLRDLRSPHRHTPGTEHAWQALEITITELTR